MVKHTDKETLESSIAGRRSPDLALSEGTLASPSLRSVNQDKPAYEVKFLLPEEAAIQLQTEAEKHLVLDPFCQKSENQTYQTSTLYFDTPRFDVFHRKGKHGREKLRIRRYEGTDQLFLEQKFKRGNKVSKVRSTIPSSEIEQFQNKTLPEEWSGSWFGRIRLERELAPVCVVTYQRIAWLLQTADGPIRLTMDRHIRGELQSGWKLSDFDSSQELLPGQRIVEMKFLSAMPLLFKNWQETFKMYPQAVSKYRRFLAGTQQVLEQPNA